MKKNVVSLISVLACAAVAVADYTPVSKENSSGSIPVFAGVEANGDVTLANDETLDNATDAKVRVTFDDDAAVLGELVLESDNASNNVADADCVSVIGKANDSLANKTEYASVDLIAADVTDGTEDGEIALKGFINGTERTLSTFGAATTLGAAQSTVAITSSDWAIDATGVASGLGNITSDGDVILANGETIDNAANSKLRATFDDDAAVLGELVLESDNASNNVADADCLSIVAKANDSLANKTEYASVDLVADDVTDGTEDGSVVAKAFVNGTERTLATFAAATTVGSAQVTSITITTDGTGTAEVAMPAGCIDSTEILDGTIATGDFGTIGITTSINVLVSGGGSNTLAFTNGLLQSCISL